MTRNEFIQLVEKKIKLIRTEKSYSQDMMAEILGISKKTLVQIEKGRVPMSWTTAVTVCTIFKDSDILDSTFGGDSTYIIQSIAFKDFIKEYSKTMGRNVWWHDIKACGIYRIQQNVVLKHFRVLSVDDRKICSSFDFDYMEKRLAELQIITDK